MVIWCPLDGCGGRDGKGKTMIRDYNVRGESVMHNKKCRDCNSMALLGLFLMVAAAACAERDERDVTSKGAGGKLRLETVSVKPVEPLVRWGRAVTATVARGVRGGLAVAELGGNSGGLSLEDERLGDGSYFDEWQYRGEAGDLLEISVTSDDFDTYVMVLRGEVGGDMALLAEDDDGGGNSNSAVAVGLQSRQRLLDHRYQLLAGRTG